MSTLGSSPQSTSSTSKLSLGLRWVAVLALLFPIVQACSLQSEGKFCNTLNDNEDCEDGLVCVPYSQLTSITTGAICCPPSGTLPSDDACFRKIDVGGGNDGGVLPNAGDAGQ